ncbi:DNA-binding protein [Pilimelia terevasa]|uniref:DNA-binding protein n=1 Tax=Pilimelia terevasa TaxID=53372 RepID=A0A8J3BMK3_9ACTN|nr:septation protein SepH [Pilimelia terevasa]GGK20043.1 DNA-binding protein [Pilimelia terevasa]
MRPVRFVALSEDGQALVLADEVGRLLALPFDDRVATVLHGGHNGPASPVPPPAPDPSRTLAPRDIQARIRSGESADEVARVAGVPVDRVLRYAGPVLQERAMLAQHARRTRLRGSDRNATLAEVVDGKLHQHGVDSDKISWDAYRRDDGTWRIVATWPSGKATAQAMWELDKARQHVSAYDDMAQYLCTERPAPLLGQESGAGLPSRGEPARGHGLPMAADGRPDPRRGVPPAAEPNRTRALPAALAEPRRADPIRSGRDALLASLDRPLGEPAAPAAGGLARPASRPVSGGAAALLGGAGSAFDEDPDVPKEVPAVPSLAVLRPRRTAAEAAEGAAHAKSRKRLPSWDDVLFGGAPARESS